MGNAQGTEKSDKEVENGEVCRISVVSPLPNENDPQPSKSSRVKFNDQKQKHVTYTHKPKMTEIGDIPVDQRVGSKYQYKKREKSGSSTSVADDSTVPDVTEATINPHPHSPRPTTNEWEKRPPKGKALSSLDEI